MSDSNINLNIDINKSLKGLTPEAIENVAEAQYRGYWGFIKKHPWIKYVYIIIGLLFLTVFSIIVYNAFTFESSWEKKIEESHRKFIEERDEAFEKSEAEYNDRVEEMEEDFKNTVEENLKNSPKINQ